uniref:Uncharacterized protein n=1 Tax=Amblyomma triste TaxID=251400 RepID=A0A023GB91_AMBTT
MRHWSAAFVLVVAFSNLSYGHPAEAADASDPANNAGSAVAVTPLSTITEEMFLQKMRTSGPYWTWMASYQDPKQTQKRMCISTQEVASTTANADTIFLQKYKFRGCHWFTNTHDAYYNVTFEEGKPSATADLRMRWVPIAKVNQRSNTPGEVYGTERNYSFTYWDEKEGCFVLTYNSATDKRECELLVWNPEVPAKAETEQKTEARSEDKTETTVEGRFNECKKSYKAQCPEASEDILFDKFCKITDAQLLSIIGEIDTSQCRQ